jgi:hypothetical protein
MDLLSARYLLGHVLAQDGQDGEAIPLLEQVTAGFDEMLGAEHPDSLYANSALAMAYDPRWPGQRGHRGRGEGGGRPPSPPRLGPCQDAAKPHQSRALLRQAWPLSAGHEAAASVGEWTVAMQVRLQVRGQMRTSGPGSATMLGVPAGVAQLAEQPSCKRQVTSSILVTGSLVLKASHNRYLRKRRNAGSYESWRSQADQDPHRIPHSRPAAGKVRAGDLSPGSAPSYSQEPLTR